MRRIAIIGCSGFYGRAMVQNLKLHNEAAEILGVDVVEPPATAAPDRFVRMDVRDAELLGLLEAFAPDTVLHFAFVVNPIRDDRKMHDINVNGARNVLQIAEKIKPARLLVASSATAYGAWPDNPVPMDENWALRARSEYRYAADKVEVEQLLADFAESHPEMAVSWTRPAIIYAEGVANYLTDFIARGPLVVLPGRNDTPMQFVHLEDVAGATRLILERDARGPFNIGPDDWLTLSELAQMSDRRVISVPLWLCMTFTRLWWGCRLPVFHFPAPLWYFVRYPWVIQPRRLTEELGYEFQFSSRQTLEEMLQCLRPRRGK